MSYFNQCTGVYFNIGNPVKYPAAVYLCFPTKEIGRLAIAAVLDTWTDAYFKIEESNVVIYDGYTEAIRIPLPVAIKESTGYRHFMSHDKSDIILSYCVHTSASNMQSDFHPL